MAPNYTILLLVITSWITRKSSLQAWTVMKLTFLELWLWTMDLQMERANGYASKALARSY
jgi:hypothetical protein